MLKTNAERAINEVLAYHLGEGRVLKTYVVVVVLLGVAHHLGEGGPQSSKRAPYVKMGAYGASGYFI